MSFKTWSGFIGYTGRRFPQGEFAGFVMALNRSCSSHGVPGPTKEIHSLLT